MTDSDSERRHRLRRVAIEERNSDAEAAVTTPPASGSARPRWRVALIPLAILAVCAALAFALIETAPVVERSARPARARLVEVVPAKLSTQTTQVVAMGTIVATREVVIQPQVTGRIVEVSPGFVPGGRFSPGEVMLRIDPSDYELAVTQRQAELAQVRAELHIEEGNQSVALLEYELLGETVLEEDRDLVLRKPQLDSVRARIASAEAALARARLDLDRTVVRAPFHALIRERGAELGMRVDPGTLLATLVDTEAYWVEAVVPVGQLTWIDVPDAVGEPGSPAKVVDASAFGPGGFREGRVVRLLGDVERDGRMARLLIRVEDPLALRTENAGAPRLLLDSYVSVRIQGRRLEKVVAIDRGLLRDGDRVWVMGAEGGLEIREVSVAFRGENRVLVAAGLADGDSLVTSELSSPVSGMPLRTAESAQAEGDAGTGTSPGSPHGG